MSELNPELHGEMLRLRQENKAMKIVVDKVSEEKFADLENDLEDEMRKVRKRETEEYISYHNHIIYGNVKCQMHTNNAPQRNANVMQMLRHTKNIKLNYLERTIQEQNE